MWLDNRLRAVVNEIHGSTRTIDVGSDHGKVIITALSEHRTAYGIASDISASSLEKARSLSREAGIMVDTRLGDGLDVIEEDEVDTAVIAGMGGNEIIKILSNYSGRVPKLILVPHKDTVKVREYLIASGYAIEKDYKVMENNFFYSIIVATTDDTHLGDNSLRSKAMGDRERYLGRDSKTNRAYTLYLDYRRKVLESILSSTEKEELRRELDVIIDEVNRHDN